MTLGLPVLWRRYLSELRIDRAVADRTRRAYETGWNSFVATSRSMGWRLRGAGDITYERLLEWQLTLKEVGKQDWTCRTVSHGPQGLHPLAQRERAPRH